MSFQDYKEHIADEVLALAELPGVTEQNLTDRVITYLAEELAIARCQSDELSDRLDDLLICVFPRSPTLPLN